MTMGDVAGVAGCEHMFVECRLMGIPDHELTVLIRSAAMAPPASKVGVEREQLIEALEELLQQRSLLRRLGDDLRTVARTSQAAARR
jgi:hypothetical protein